MHTQIREQTALILRISDKFCVTLHLPRIYSRGNSRACNLGIHMLRSESLTSFIGNTLLCAPGKLLSKNLHVTPEQFGLRRSVGTVF
jgi:hypothetical protein